MAQSKEKQKYVLGDLWTNVPKMVSFILLLIIYLLYKFGNILTRFLETKTKSAGIKPNQSNLFQKFKVKSNSVYNRLIALLDSRRTGTISRVELIELSLRNMKAKKTRTFITVGGMMIGIGTIVFLVSVGYGFERLVITRVARLDEMKQADVSPQAGGKVKINDKSLADFKEIPEIESVLPLIAVVGRVSYKNSVTDMAVYGVTSEYLKQSAIKPVTGKIFDSNELALITPDSPKGQVAGVSTERNSGNSGETIQNVDFTIDQGAWIRIRESPSANGKILGYTKRVEGQGSGEEVWGSNYLSDDNAGSSGSDENGNTLGKWIKASVLLWNNEKCDPTISGDCEGGKYTVARDESNQQVQATGYFAEIGVKLSGVNIKSAPQVLGLSTSNNSKSLDWVEIASESGVVKPAETKIIDLSSKALRQAVVNRAMLSILGIKENEAIGKKFSSTFVVVGELLADSAENIESTQTEYTIIGVTPEEKTPVFYVPFIDLRTLGISNFSQVKAVVKDQNSLAKVRRQVESMGYITRSVADTVAQINSLFGTARTILALLGMVALAVASLGMFNTLTVSLLERTREVGLMKAMGMKSSEVQELFLTESIIMGFFGGILGIGLGWILGKLIGILLSFLAIFKGVGLVDVSYIPPTFILVIVFLSLLVGLITGIYPARRATRISALNALRYE